MLLQPFIGSVIALKFVNQTMFAALICVVLAFLIRSPLLTLARQQWVWREQKPETRSARLQVLVELLIMAIAAWQLVLVWPREAVIGLGAIAGALNILAVSMTVHNRQREVWFQALSAAGLSLSGIAACISLTGGIPGWAWGWWALHTGHFWTGIMVVHVRLQARIDAKHTAGVMSPALRGLTTQAKIVQGVVAAAGLALIGLGYLYYGIAVILSAAVHLRDIAAASTQAGVEMSMQTVGRRALVLGIVFTCLLIAGVWSGQ
jgi:hypothetical protein